MARVQWQPLFDDQVRALVSAPVSVVQLQSTTAAALHAAVAATGALAGGDIAPLDGRQVLERVPLPNASAIDPSTGDAAALVTRDARHLQALCSWVDFLWRRLRPVTPATIESLSAPSCLNGVIAADRGTLSSVIADPDDAQTDNAEGGTTSGAMRFLCTALDVIQVEAERTLLPHLLIAVLRLVELTVGRTAAATPPVAVGGTVIAQLRAMGAMIGRWGVAAPPAAPGAAQNAAGMFEVSEGTQRAVALCAAYVAALLKPGADAAAVASPSVTAPNLAEYFPILAVAAAKQSSGSGAPGAGGAPSGGPSSTGASLGAFDAATILDLTAAMQKLAVGLNALPAGESSARQIAEETITELASLVALASSSSASSSADATAGVDAGAAAARAQQQQQLQYLWTLLRERRVDDAVPLLETALRTAAALPSATPGSDELDGAATTSDGEQMKKNNKKNSAGATGADSTSQLRLLFKRELAAAEAELKEIQSAAAAAAAGPAAGGAATTTADEKPRAMTAGGRPATSSASAVPKAMEVLKPSTPVPPLSSFALQLAEIVATESRNRGNATESAQQHYRGDATMAQTSAALVPGPFDSAPPAAAKRAMDTLPFVTGTHSRFHAFPTGECGRPPRFGALFAPVEAAPSVDAAGGAEGPPVVRCGVSRRWAESNVAWARAAWTSSVPTVVACEPTERRLASLATGAASTYDVSQQQQQQQQPSPALLPSASVLQTGSVHSSIPALFASNAAARKVLACSGGEGTGGAAGGAHPDGCGGCGGIYVGWADAALLVPELFA